MAHHRAGFARDDLLQVIWINQHACVEDTKFGPDVSKFLRVHVASVLGEKAESREASFAEIDLWHTGVGPDPD
jgi:hypothetical protein